MSWTQTKSSSPGPRPAQPNDMVKGEFIALDRGLLKHPSTVISWRCLTAAPGSDASAIHGRLGARVALLQSPILPAAILPYPEKELFRNVPVDKPHTCNLEPFKPETPRIALYVVVALRRLTLQVVCVGHAHFQLTARLPESPSRSTRENPGRPCGGGYVKRYCHSAKRLECVQLAAALGLSCIIESGSKLHALQTLRDRARPSRTIILH